jgi:hypothetical protein
MTVEANLIGRTFNHLSLVSRGLNIAITTLQNAAPTALKENQMKENRISWIMGASIVALSFCLTGCLEGSGYYRSSDGYVNRSSQESGPDNLNSVGLEGLYQPFGTVIPSPYDSAAVLAQTFPNQIHVSTEDDFEQAFKLATTQGGQFIFLDQSIVIDREIALSGMVYVYPTSGASTLTFNPSGKIRMDALVRETAKAVRFQACSKPAASFLITASVLKIGAPVSNLHITGSHPFEVITSGPSDNDPLLLLETTGPGLVIGTAVTPSISGTKLALDSTRFVERSTPTFIQRDSPNSNTVYNPPGGQLLLYQAGSITSDGHCYKLSAGQFYDVFDYSVVQNACYSGGWPDLMESYANCRGAL